MSDVVELLVAERLREKYVCVRVSGDIYYNGLCVVVPWFPWNNMYFTRIRSHIFAVLMGFARVGICSDIVVQCVLGRVWNVAIPVYQYDFCSARAVSAIAECRPVDEIASSLDAELGDIARQRSFTFICAGRKHEFYINIFSPITPDGFDDMYVLMNATRRPKIGSHVHIYVGDYPDDV